MIKAVIFDLDGTIVSFKINYMKARYEVEEYLRSLGVPDSILKMGPIFTTLGEGLTYLTSKGYTQEEVQEVKKHVEEIVLKYEIEASKKTTLLPGIKDTLNKIKDMGLKIGLFTLNNKSVTENVLLKNGIRKFFDVVVTRNDTKKVKPHKDHFIEVISGLNVKPEETIIIGDTIYDFLAAKKLGAICIGIVGLYDEEFLKNKGKVDFVVKETNKVVDLIASLLKNKNL
ncbi:MAG: HAD family hydrolase [Candidatus Odinarchaeia archaeon]